MRPCHTIPQFYLHRWFKIMKIHTPVIKSSARYWWPVKDDVFVYCADGVIIVWTVVVWLAIMMGKSVYRLGGDLDFIAQLGRESVMEFSLRAVLGDKISCASHFIHKVARLWIHSSIHCIVTWRSATAFPGAMTELWFLCSILMGNIVGP